MKILLSIGILIFALSFCNLSERFSGGDTKDFKPADPADANSAKQGDESAEVEKAELTPEMSKLLDGDPLKWEEQGLSWKLPKGWKKLSQTRTTLNWGSPDNAFLIATISPMGDDFPVDISTKAYYDQAIGQMKNGKYKSVQYTEIDGIKGVEFVESAPEDGGDPRRHQWIAYRTYGGQVQMLNIMLSTNGNNFDKHADEFEAIMNSMGIVK